MNTFNDSEILKNALVGVEFEFFSDMSVEDTAKQLEKVLDKKIRVETKAHSDFEVTSKEFKIEPDMSGGQGLMELVTGACPYYEGRLIIIRVLQWIEENGWTTDRAGIHLNLSFDKNKIDNKNRISKMNVLKFILDFKEDQVYKFFPKREGSAYAKSIKMILPTKDTYFFDGKHISSQNFMYPDSKYYGINFEKRHKNYLEFRYLGGKDYEKKTSTILHLLDGFLMQLWKSTENNDFSALNALELKRILAENERIILSRKDWRNIEKCWKDIELTVDLKKNEQIVDLHWTNIKERVMRLFTHGNIVKGRINYDTDTGRVQLADGVLEYCIDLREYDFVNSSLRGEFRHCDMFRCDLNGSDIENCNFFQSSQINSSKVKSSYVHQSCHVNDCYVFGIDGIMKGHMKGGIFREGKYDKKTATFDGVEKILYQEI
jgi:uncharacterized protein YjbI with pentapeptide repeats